MSFRRTLSLTSCQNNTIPTANSHSEDSYTRETFSNLNFNGIKIFRIFVQITAFAQIALSVLLLFGAFTTVYRTHLFLIVYPLKSLSNGYLFLIMGAFIGLCNGIIIVSTQWQWRTFSKRNCYKLHYIFNFSFNIYS